jgi:hypothetical protein
MNYVGKVSDGVEIKVGDLAKAMVLAGTKGSSGLTSLGAGSPPSSTFKRTNDAKVTVINNADSLRLAKASATAA